MKGERGRFDCYRVVHNNDMVPSAPPYNWKFRHVGKPIWLCKRRNNWGFVYWTMTEPVPHSIEETDEAISRPYGYSGSVWPCTTLFRKGYCKPPCFPGLAYDHYRMVWYCMVWYGMVRYGTVWYGMVWYGMVWYGMVWYYYFLQFTLQFIYFTVNLQFTRKPPDAMLNYYSH
jgi:hypothetical protein